MGNHIATGSKPVDHAKVRELLAQKTAEKTAAEAKKAQQRFDEMYETVVLDAKNKDLLDPSLRSFDRNDPSAPRAILLSGGPGTGKTTLAKAIGKAIGGKFLFRTIADLKQAHVGASAQAAKKLWQDAAAAGRAVLFLDECESVFASRGGSEGDAFTKEIVGVFLPYLEGMVKEGNILFIAATNIPDLLDTAIVSRFNLHLKLTAPDLAARKRILSASAKTYRVATDLLDQVAESTEGLAGRDLDHIVKDAAQRIGAGSDVPAAMQAAVGARRSATSVSTKKLTWDDVAVDDHVVTTLQRVTKILANREKLRGMGIDVSPKGVLLHGPPGTGKTQLARIVASTSGLTFHAASSADVKAGFVGQSGQGVRNLFSKARATSPCILFLDELDVIAPVRGSGTGDQATQEIIGQLLQEMDGVKAVDGAVMIMAATNLPQSIDPAVLSRFGERLLVPLPDEPMRARIVQAIVRQKPIDGDRTAFAASVAQRTEGKSGRDLANLIDAGMQRLAMRAIDEPDGAQVGLRLNDLDLGS